MMFNSNISIRKFEYFKVNFSALVYFLYAFISLYCKFIDSLRFDNMRIFINNYFAPWSYHSVKYIGRRLIFGKFIVYTMYNCTILYLLYYYTYNIYDTQFIVYYLCVFILYCVIYCIFYVLFSFIVFILK